MHLGERGEVQSFYQMFQGSTNSKCKALTDSILTANQQCDMTVLRIKSWTELDSPTLSVQVKPQLSVQLHQCTLDNKVDHVEKTAKRSKSQEEWSNR